MGAGNWNSGPHPTTQALLPTERSSQPHPRHFVGGDEPCFYPPIQRTRDVQCPFSGTQQGALGTYLLPYALCSQKLTLPTASVSQRSQDNAARRPYCPPKKLQTGVPTVTSVLSREPEPSAPDAHTCLLAEGNESQRLEKKPASPQCPVQASNIHSQSTKAWPRAPEVCSWKPVSQLRTSNEIHVSKTALPQPLKLQTRIPLHPSAPVASAESWPYLYHHHHLDHHCVHVRCIYRHMCCDTPELLDGVCPLLLPF